MNSTDRKSPNLLPTAALVSLLVLLLGATGLFALSYTNAKSALMLERLGRLHAAQVAAVEARADFKTQVQEWKDLLLRGRDPADYKTYRGHFEKSEADVRVELAAAQSQLSDLGLDSAPVARLLSDHEELGAAYRRDLARYRPEDPGFPFAADAAVRGIDRKLSQDIDALARSVEAVSDTELDGFRAAAAGRYARLREVALGLGALTVLAAFALVFQAARAGSPRRNV
jgi:hypothetical protein